jgi:glycosyltransferase involved in cell wall biosynthesis
VTDRVAHIGPTALPIGYEFGGAIERRMVELARVQCDRGAAVRIYSAGDRESEWMRGEVTVRQIRCRAQGHIRDFEFLKGLQQDLARFAPDVVHFHGQWAGALMSKKIDSLKVLSFDYFRYGWCEYRLAYAQYRRGLGAFDLLLPVSEFCRRAAQAWWRLAESALCVVPNGVNIRQFRPDGELRERMRRRLEVEDEIVVLYVGRVCRQKGIDVLIDAFRGLAFPKRARLVVAGPPERFGRDGDSVLTRNICTVGGVWLGAIAEDELAALYNGSDIFVLPTRTDEMFGMVAAEALACGKPVIASALGGLPEVVSSRSGVFVAPGNVSDLRAALYRLIADNSLREELASFSRRDVLKYSWEAVAERAEVAYGIARANSK